jgi:hypothetical protein
VFDGKGYSGCLGRSDATRVFMSSLGDVKDKTLQEAINSSGLVLPVKADVPGMKVFVWVYAPSFEGEAKVVRATWGAVLDNFTTWIVEESCAKPAAD